MSTNQSTSVPVHLGIILDGNRRWARSQNLPTLEGHKKGYERLKDIAKYAFEQGVAYVSAYVFSTENWNRSQEEVDYLMSLLLWVARNELKELNKRDIKVQFLGEKEKLSPKVIKAIENVEAKTAHNTGGTLLLCLNYGGKQEIATAVTNVLRKQPGITTITPELIEQNLYQPEVPSVDLVIRTSGEQRISNFMLWRVAYSEFYFAKTPWPAFTTQELQAALDDYAQRQRRFGGN
jgi:undecaprenyl diphosphate synthase